MNHEFLAASAQAAEADTDNNIITLGSGCADRVEMTRANHTQLQREMARTFDDPFAALMEQVAVELTEMTKTPARRNLQPA